MAIRKLEVKSNLEKVIEKGGFVTADKNVDISERKQTYMNFRMPAEIAVQVIKSCKIRYISKNAWILEAIQEKLKRQETNEMD